MPLLKVDSEATSNNERNHHCGKKVQKRGFSGQYFPVFGLNTDKKTPYLDTFRAVHLIPKV